MASETKSVALDEDMVAELREVFALFDKDSGGTITADELGVGMVLLVLVFSFL